jgi:hypothetical protein
MLTKIIFKVIKENHWKSIYENQYVTKWGYKHDPLNPGLYRDELFWANNIHKFALNTRLLNMTWMNCLTIYIYFDILLWTLQTSVGEHSWTFMNVHSKFKVHINVHLWMNDCISSFLVDYTGNIIMACNFKYFLNYF